MPEETFATWLWWKIAGASERIDAERDWDEGLFSSLMDRLEEEVESFARQRAEEMVREAYA